jgi:hypothetical protein
MHNLVTKGHTLIMLKCGEVSQDSCHVFPVLKQNVGSYRFKGVRDVETWHDKLC